MFLVLGSEQREEVSQNTWSRVSKNIPTVLNPLGCWRLGTKLIRHVCMLNCFSPVRLFATLWTVALQAPLSTGFSRQEHWSGLPCPPPGDLPDPCLFCLLHWQVGSLPLAPTEKPKLIRENPQFHYSMTCSFWGINLS